MSKATIRWTPRLAAVLAFVGGKVWHIRRKTPKAQEPTAQGGPLVAGEEGEVLPRAREHRGIPLERSARYCELGSPLPRRRCTREDDADEDKMGTRPVTRMDHQPVHLPPATIQFLRRGHLQSKARVREIHRTRAVAHVRQAHAGPRLRQGARRARACIRSC